MKSEHPVRIKSIFTVAIGLTSPFERRMYLDKVCAGVPGIRPRVDALLTAHDRNDVWLEEPVALFATSNRIRLNEQPGAQIGNFNLLQQIGEGGMGTVFVAEQTMPVRRRVALKVIRPGMDTEDVIARFETEMQTLAMMTHPNIAQVFDAGLTEAGRPYFAMELIQGVSIDDYCDEHQLSLRQRLVLFLDVCRAVHHAHLRGVIHRDLKPSNILVTSQEDVPIVKIIDFGIAKAVGEQRTDKESTRFAHVLGTPLYMSPEQTVSGGIDVDVRSDVYSLGVLLYELLAGVAPFDRDRFATLPLEAARRIIRDEDAPAPSKRVGSLGKELASVAAQRQVSATRIANVLQGELDWIVMSCLVKDRSCRYQSVVELSADIDRYLRNESVSAAPPSMAYKIRKAVSRHRVAITVAVGYIVLSLGALIWTAHQNHEIRVQTTVARAQTAKAETAYRDLAAANAKTVDAIENLEGSLFDRAIAAALSGNDATFASVMSELKSLKGARENDVRCLDALESVCAGRVHKAISALESIVERDESNIAAWAVLDFAYSDSAMNLNETARVRGQLQHMRAATEFDQIMLSIATPGADIDSLRSLTSANPGWGVARALLARTLCSVARRTSRDSLLREARVEIDAAKRLRPDNPFVVSICLEVATVEYVFASRGKQSQTVLVNTEQDALRMVDQLESRFGNHRSAMRSVATWHSVRGDFEAALPLWRTLAVDLDSSLAISYYVPISLLQERPLELEESLVFPPYYLYIDEPSKAIRAVETSRWKDWSLGRAWKASVYLLCGLEKEADLAIQQAMPLAHEQAPWISNVVKLYAGLTDADAMLQASKTDSVIRTHHLMTLACHALTLSGGRDKAREYLEQALAVDCRTVDTYYWCKMIIKKLDDDPLWPTSLERILESETSRNSR